jgi:hypothetical protein
VHHALTQCASETYPRPARFRGDEPSTPATHGELTRTRVENGWVVARTNTQAGQGRIVQFTYVYDPEDG